MADHVANQCPRTSFSYVIVSKRINAKFMVNEKVPTNPLAGTVIDDVVVSVSSNNHF